MTNFMKYLVGMVLLSALVATTVVPTVGADNPGKKSVAKKDRKQREKKKKQKKKDAKHTSTGNKNPPRDPGYQKYGIYLKTAPKPKTTEAVTTIFLVCAACCSRRLDRYGRFEVDI